jgi:hypothetical protein
MKGLPRILSALCALFLLAACEATGPTSDAAPTITAQPVNVAVAAGEAALFQVTASGSGTLSFQWSREGVVIAGATSAAYTTPAAIADDSGTVYTVQVSNDAGSVTSAEAKLLVFEAGSLLATLLQFAETGLRNWNHGGHTVDDRFNESQGRWDYTNTTYEPWLFDRPEVWRMLGEMTGDGRWLTQANTDLAYYESRLSAAGLFLNRGDDTKYSYVHAWGTDAAKQTAAYNATVVGWPNTANLSPGAMWTERELWVALNAAVHYHTATGNAAALTRAQAMVDQWDAVTAGRGAPLVTYTMHEGGGPGGTTPTDLVTSPWMAALYFQAARLYIAKVPARATQVHQQASAYFDWLNTPANRGFYQGSEAHVEHTGLIFPGYLAGGTTIGDAGASEAHMDHALDIAGFIAFAIKAKQALGLPTTAAEARLSDMKVTAAQAFTNATRSTAYLPRYRVNPARKFLWWTRGMYELRANGGG